MESWTLAVDRTDLSKVLLSSCDAPVAADGEAVLRVERVGVTANNVTYAVLGDAFRYWEFFPAPEGWGHVPLWGFAVVSESRADGVTEGQRVYGYLPPAGHLVVAPSRVDERGFRDARPHRAGLPSPYNAYASTTGDAAYEPDREDLQVLYRPLFFTSFMLADWLADNGFSGADAVVVSSASSKTAYGAAFLLRDSGRRLVGLTSPSNVAFTESLGVYDTVLPYDAVPSLDAVPSVYVDVAGSAPLRESLRARLGAALVADVVVGITQQDASPVGSLEGPRPQVFFAPDQMRKRSAEWGRDGLDERFGAAWRSFAPAVSGWVDVVAHSGPEALRDVWLDVLAGRANPRDGHVVTF